ncbi:hypothetical protein DIPPA_32896 [Diplonema papillatum]|nr:hypothetical protein DIPPA_32896 [Diplonema papillatum]
MEYNSTGGKSPRVLIIRPARVLLADPKQYVISRSINPLKIREIFIQNDYDGSHMALVVEDEFSVKMQLDGGHAENFVRILTSAMTAQHRPAPQLTRVPRPGRSIHDDNIHINVPKDMLKKPTSFQSPTLLLSVKQKREKLGVSVKSLNGQKRHLSPLHQDAADSFEDRADVGSDGSTPTATSMSPPEPCTPYKPLLDQQRLQAEIERQLREVSAKAEEARGEAGGLDGRSPLADRRPIPPHLKHPSIVDYNAASYYIDPMRPHKGPIVDFSQCEAAMEGVYTPPEARSPLGLPSHPRTRSNQFLSNIGASQAGAVSHFSEFTPPASPTELPRQHLQGDRQEDWLLASMTNALEVEVCPLFRVSLA